jgi:hypothetical protein
MQPEFNTIPSLFFRIRLYSFGVQNGVRFGVQSRTVGKHADIHLPFRSKERARSEKASASGNGVHEGLPSGAGLGRREARRQGLGTAQVPNDKKNG